MTGLIAAITAFNRGIGRTVAWFSLAIVLIQFLVVVMRYVFGVGSIWTQELIVYLFAFLFMLAAAYTLSEDGHVRVDIFYRTAPPRRKALVNALGVILFLFPMCAVIFFISLPYVISSWQVLEGSRETSGVPAIFLLKTAIPAFGVLMALQGLALLLQSVLALAGHAAALDSFKQN